MTLEYAQYTNGNKYNVNKSTECACIYCFAKFHPTEIVDYCDTSTIKEITALCPYCYIDAIIPNNLIKYTNEDLQKWHNIGFQI